MKRCIFLLLIFFATSVQAAYIRINQLGYLPAGIKVAVWGSLTDATLQSFELLDSASGKVVFKAAAGKAFGSYGPFKQSYRLDFSSFKTPGTYQLRTGNISSPYFRIARNVYQGSADFCLRYLRQQRCGFNPFLKDSCHTFDGYTLYGPMPDSTHINAIGGWHDASDYLQYSTTSANTAYHLLAAYRDFPKVFGDQHDANGLPGKNSTADVLDEARWGLDWLLRMHPQDDWLFNQIADDRDHKGMRIPGLDPFYGRGFERPVYFCSGEPQVQGVKYNKMNKSTGVASTAGKFSSAFSLAYSLFQKNDPVYASQLLKRANTAYSLGVKKPGVQQTASVLSPYIYAEDNWTDDMELAAAQLFAVTKKQAFLKEGQAYAAKETVTPWLGKDTASHYQWYPFINIGHYELAKHSKGTAKQQLVQYYRTGVERVWEKAKENAFYRGVPFIWCSNNLTTSFAIQCYWYQQLSGDASFAALAQANFDWLFGCNPWGTSMVYGLPANGDTPVDPHSAFTHLKNYPIDGGLVDGPVYGTIYNSLIGIRLADPDEYAAFQSSLVVYHDDYGDYSTNEPTMDGTASLIYLLALKENEGN
ncbi:glycoside hydrolase family 9 protein [Chitinophaga niabensis]|uniref:N-terminal ig-like domain of cellulase n=1 Tax=Chitinophaga niabensis TaxID=536979 RepID=A0A1N6JU23_9BACT|nr:glycoside hydrolase family 9 protein [Chitinophaga niabensis]SIO47868.1 N-terminal ig-like domain of cellulase [Chitinophaga niabensis]